MTPDLPHHHSTQQCLEELDWSVNLLGDGPCSACCQPAPYWIASPCRPAASEPATSTEHLKLVNLSHNALCATGFELVLKTLPLSHNSICLPSAVDPLNHPALEHLTSVLLSQFVLFVKSTNVFCLISCFSPVSLFLALLVLTLACPDSEPACLTTPLDPACHPDDCSLTHLNLAGNGLMDSSVSTLASCVWFLSMCLPLCPSMVSVDLSWNPAVTSAGLHSILSNQRPLTYLNLQGCQVAGPWDSSSLTFRLVRPGPGPVAVLPDAQQTGLQGTAADLGPEKAWELLPLQGCQVPAHYCPLTVRRTP
ncbi:tonsoku-like protein [Salvelinus alpinus]